MVAVQVNALMVLLMDSQLFLLKWDQMESLNNMLIVIVKIQDVRLENQIFWKTYMILKMLRIY